MTGIIYTLSDYEKDDIENLLLGGVDLEGALKQLNLNIDPHRAKQILFVERGYLLQCKKCGIWGFGGDGNFAFSACLCMDCDSHDFGEGK